MVGERALTLTYSSVKAKQRLRSWITSLALSATLGPQAGMIGAALLVTAAA